MQQDGEDAPALLVARQIFDGLDAQVAQRQQRVASGGVAQALGQLFGRQAHLAEQFVEQMGLVLEMPVHRAAGHAGGLGDLLQGAVRHPFFQEQQLGRGEDRGAGLLGLFFGSAHGDVS